MKPDITEISNIEARLFKQKGGRKQKYAMLYGMYLMFYYQKKITWDELMYCMADFMLKDMQIRR